jgi:hypothetical protein
MRSRLICLLLSLASIFPATIAFAYVNGIGRAAWSKMSSEERAAYEFGGEMAVKQLRLKQLRLKNRGTPLDIEVNNTNRIFDPRNAQETTPPMIELSVPDMIESLKSSDAHKRHAAALNLRYTGDAGRWAVPMLIQALRDPDSDVRWVAAGTLGHLGSHAEPAIPALRRVAQDANPNVRKSAAQALLMIDLTTGSAGPSVIPSGRNTGK